MLFMYKKYLKRAIDIVLSLLAIIILAVPNGVGKAGFLDGAVLSCKGVFQAER